MPTFKENTRKEGQMQMWLNSETVYHFVTSELEWSKAKLTKERLCVLG